MGVDELDGLYVHNTWYILWMVIGFVITLKIGDIYTKLIIISENKLYNVILVTKY